ncbi:MAG TPA: response regulator [Terriglobales bacterium]|nr:response regulator [Terriglobales bacterium]
MGQRIPKLLCVDDDPQSLSVRRVFLEAFGFDVTTCSNPRLSLRYADLNAYSAAILDFQMPEMNGGELASELKKRNPQMPVIILSALSALPEGTPDAYDAFVCKGESGFALVNKVQELIADAEANESATERKPMSIARRVPAMAGIVAGIVAEKIDSRRSRQNPTLHLTKDPVA